MHMTSDILTRLLAQIRGADAKRAGLTMAFFIDKGFTIDDVIRSMAIIQALYEEMDPSCEAKFNRFRREFTQALKERRTI
jgi:hypothetical protein